MSGGIDKIPLRIPEQWDARWFRRFVYETLSLADVRNANAGAGIQITGDPDKPATISGSADLEALVNAGLVTAVPEMDLPFTRVLTGDPGVIEVADGGPGSAVQIRFAWGIPINRLAPVPGLSVLGAPAEGDLSELEAIESTDDHQVLRRVPEGDPEAEGDSVIDWGPLTLPMAPDNLWTYAKLQQGEPLSVLGVASDSAANLADIEAAADHAVLRRSGDAIGFGTVAVAGGGTGRTSLTANALLVGDGTDPVAFLAPGAAGQVVRSDGGGWFSAQLAFSDLAGSIADGQVPASAVVQHQAALTIDWGQLSSVPLFAAVAFTGDYADLSNTPAIPPDLSALDFLTHTDETSTLTNSRRLVAGSNVSFDTGTAGVLEISATGGSGSPGGSDRQVQFNDSGSFGGSSGLVYTAGGDLELGGNLDVEGFIEVTRSSPDIFRLGRTTAPANERNYLLTIDNGGNLFFSARDDSWGSAQDFMLVDRGSGTNISNTRLYGSGAELRIGSGGTPDVRVSSGALAVDGLISATLSGVVRSAFGLITNDVFTGNTDAAVVGRASSIAGTNFGDLVLRPRTDAARTTRIYAGMANSTAQERIAANPTNVQIVVDSAELRVGTGGSPDFRVIDGRAETRQVMAVGSSIETGDNVNTSLQWRMRRQDLTSNDGVYQFNITAAGTLELRTADNAGANAETVFQALRTGTTVDAFSVFAGGGHLRVGAGASPEARVVPQADGSLRIRDFVGAERNAGFREAVANTENSAYTFGLRDCQRTVYTNSGGPTYTIPPASSVNFPSGSMILVVNAAGGSSMTVTPGSGVNLFHMRGDGTTTNGAATVGPRGVATLWKVSGDNWFIWGTI